MTATATAPEPPNALREQLTATDKRVELIALDSLNRRGLQLRESTDADTVARYADAYKAGEHLPPIVVFRDPNDDILHLADGHHRVAAAKRAQLTELHAIVKKGDRRAAILYAAGANGQHGLPLTNADKRRIVTLLLADAEWRAWSNREIARCARVSEALVRIVRKETGTEVEAIKRKDGSVQKPRNAESKKPQQQDLFDQPDPAISERYAAVLPLLGCDGSGFEALHATKRAILAACYALVPSGQTDPGTTRDRLRTITGLPPDTHLDGLLKSEYLECNDARTDWRLTRSGRLAIDALLVKAGKILADSRPGQAEDFLLPFDDITQEILDQTLERYAKHPDGSWKNPSRVDLGRLGDASYELIYACDGAGDETTWHARVAITRDGTTWSGPLDETDRGLMEACAKAIRALDLGGLTAERRGYLLDLAQYLIDSNTPQDELDARAQPEAGNESHDSTASVTERMAGPEEITATVEHAGEQRPVVLREATHHLRPLGLRRVDAQRDLIAVELGKGKPRWTGTDNDLLLLALICGVPTRTQAWIDASRAQARELFIDALRTEVSERIRSGEAVDGRRWPCLAELCRLWGLDFASIEIRAERAVPE